MRFLLSIFLSGALLLVLCHGEPLVACPFKIETLASGLDLPTDVAFCGNKAFILEKKGTVRLLEDGVLRDEPVLDIRGQVNDYWDRGLLGISLDWRNCEERPTMLYLAYTTDNPVENPHDGAKSSRVSRLALLEGDVADPASEKYLLDNIPSESFTHSIGGVRVDINGYVWATHGDGQDPFAHAEVFRVQDLDSPNGKVFRMTTDGQGLPDNPFYNGDPDAIRSKVWAYGIRNAFRFALRPGYEDAYYCGDVGQNTIEEIDYVPKGANMGWPCYEGRNRFGDYEPFAQCQQMDDTVPPLYQWTHDRTTTAAVGGVFVSAWGGCWANTYTFGNYGGDVVFHMAMAEPPDTGCKADTCVPQPLVRQADGPVAFAWRPNWGLYYVAIDAGEVRRIFSDSEPASCGSSPPTGVTSLSDWWWIGDPINGRGQVEINSANGGPAPRDGRPMTVKGRRYAKGLGVSAPSEIRFRTGGRCSQVTGSVGVDDSAKAAGVVRFRILGGPGPLPRYPPTTSLFSFSPV